MTPDEMRAQITQELLSMMDGDTEQDRMRNLALLDFAKRENNTERKKFMAKI